MHVPYLEFSELSELHLSEVKDVGVGVLKNTLRNLCFLPQSFALKKEKLSLQKPVVLLGFGPSLKEGIPFLKKIREKVYLLSSASASLFLEEEGIVPDALALIDPNLKETCLGPIAKQRLPLFTTLSASHRILSACEGIKIFIDYAKGDDLQTSLYETAFGKIASVEKGWTVIDFLVALSDHLGFDPVYLVGLDLGYHQGEKYPGVVEAVPENLSDHLFSRKDWKMSARWLEHFFLCSQLNLFRVHPSKAPLAIPTLSWDQVLAEHSGASQMSRLEDLLAAHFLKATGIAPLEKMQASLEKCLQLTEEFFTLLKKGKESFAYYPHGLLLSHEIETEWYGAHVVEPLWQRWEKTLIQGFDEKSWEYAFNKTLFFDSVLKKHKLVFTEENVWM